MNPRICDAIRNREVVHLTYDWGHRVVEPHAYGVSKDGHEVLRAYQTGGQSESHAYVGWKLFRIDEITGFRPTGQHFSGPRPDYRRDDKAMRRQIYAQL